VGKLVATVVLASCLWGSARGVALAQREGDNPFFLTAPTQGTSHEAWLEHAREYRHRVRQDLERCTDGAARRNYERPDLAWMSRNFTCAMCMMYDTGFYDAATNEYRIDSVLADGQREFGGYDSIVLWHAYPRLGFDERNQFDFYRDMPGGLAGLRALVERCHAQGVRVFIDYNPWDTGTRREPKHDYDALAEVVAAIDADGVFLDTLAEGSQRLREVLDNTKPGLAIVSEGNPPVEQLAICSGSWGQWLDAPAEPGILKLKWVEPRHMQYQIRRWDRSRREEIAIAWFNGSGLLVWENVFGTYNPWQASDRHAWKKANLILDFCADCFASTSSRPFYPARAARVTIHHWPQPEYDLFVLQNDGERLSDERLFDVACEPTTKFFDLWNGRALEPQIDHGRAAIRGSLGQFGCVLAVKSDAELPKLPQLVAALAQVAPAEEAAVDPRNAVRPVADAAPVAATRRARRTEPPAGMVYVPGHRKTFEIEHVRGECGCYPDAGTVLAEDDFGYELRAGAVHPQVIHESIKHAIGPVAVQPFFIDEAEVSNAEYKTFLERSGYVPSHRENFLKHWPDGQMPPALADHPVVYVDVDDARAYAKWAGKRLPTEFEWQLAAQGLDNRTWPWGDEFDSHKCNTSGTMTMPVRSCMEGISPCGCYHMAGNVWEWTESCRDDGHTRFTMIRGGSYFRAEGSVWYAQGGPQPCGHHAKFIQVWPGLDRCSTIGFRCVVDAD